MGFVLPDIATENRLLARANRGDKAAITEIYEQYFPPIYQYVRLQVGGDITLAEDVTSEVFFRLVNSMGTRRAPRETLRGWLFQVARNEIYRHFGKNRRYPQADLDEWLASDIELEVQVIRSVDAEHAQRALRMLAPEQREVLILRFVEMLSLEETGMIMGKSTAAIKSLQFRAVNTLRGILGHPQGDRHG